jgi:hypothetical protein
MTYPTLTIVWSSFTLSILSHRARSFQTGLVATAMNEVDLVCRRDGA